MLCSVSKWRTSPPPMLCSVTHDTTFSIRSSVLLHPGWRLAHIVVLEIGTASVFFFFLSFIIVKTWQLDSLWTQYWDRCRWRILRCTNKNEEKNSWLETVSATCPTLVGHWLYTDCSSIYTQSHMHIRHTHPRTHIHTHTHRERGFVSVVKLVRLVRWFFRTFLSIHTKHRSDNHYMQHIRSDFATNPWLQRNYREERQRKKWVKKRRKEEEEEGRRDLKNLHRMRSGH